MDPIIANAAAGLRSRMESLDMLANNIANAATGGFKADREYFGVFSGSEEDGGSASSVAMPSIDKQWTDFSQGVLGSTGNPLDVAISGEGFFAVKGPTGDLYTRNGNFQLDPKGRLTTKEGYAVLDASGGEIRLAANKSVQVTLDGELKQAGAAGVRLQFAQFKDRSTLSKQGSNYFRHIGPAEQKTPAKPEVHQGKLENSNVSTAESAVRLVNVMRHFEMLQRAVTMTSDLGRRSLEEIAKVGS